MQMHFSVGFVGIVLTVIVEVGTDIFQLLLPGDAKVLSMKRIHIPQIFNID